MERPVLGEMGDEDLKDTLRINNLRKEFNEDKVAVDNMTISMFKG